MSTTQRSESMNNQIKMYIGYNYDLGRFFEHFERLLVDRRYEELKADYKDNHSTPSLPFPVEILKHAANVYTLTLYKAFQSELWVTWDCEMHMIESTCTITSYEIIPPGKPHHHIVQFDSSSSVVACSCKKFEFAGILCAHALKVLSFQNFKRVPDKYILKRWTKQAKVRDVLNSATSTRSNDPKVDVGTRYKALLKCYSHLSAQAALSEQSFHIAIDDGEKTLGKVEASLKHHSIEETLMSITQTDESMENAKQFRGIKSKPRQKGRGSSLRPKSALEKATKRKKGRNNKLEADQEWNSNLNMSIMNQANMTSMVGLLQAQISQPQFLLEDRSNENQKDT